MVGGGGDGAPVGYDRRRRRQQNVGGAAAAAHSSSSKSTISRFGERFRDGQYMFIIFLFAVLLLTVPPCPAICISGGTCPPYPMESAPPYQSTAFLPSYGPLGPLQVEMKKLRG